MAKRKRSSAPDPARPADGPSSTDGPRRRRQPSRGTASAPTNPNVNPDVIDGPSALRASPDSGEAVGAPPGPRAPGNTTGARRGTGNAITEDIATPLAEADEHDRAAVTGSTADTSASSNAAQPLPSDTAAADLPGRQPARSKRKKSSPQHVKVDSAEGSTSDGNVAAAQKNVTGAPGNALETAVGVTIGPEHDDAAPDENEDEEELKEALSRPPPVNSSYLPLPWKGRLGYACLNTYLRSANPPVFSSRTCRIASILEHRHPLKDPSQPEHATKNRPDKDQPADIARGQKYVEELGLANARDIIKMVRWNDRYGIKFMRLSSEMFPFASHDVYGYRLAPFASETLAAAGKVIAKLGHRVTTHPGQFTQLGSPRKQVIDAAIRDLDYHAELLSLLKLPPQQDRDAVMILHLGGAFGDKPATLDRFRENYARLPQGVKDRLVLENDDVVWCVHELLPLCQELNIPFVLDFHHHNILFDASKIREGTKDIVGLFPAILETWKRKNKTPKMHYSESCPDAISNRSRRKHSPRVMTLPPCPDTMDLMIEAKDKEQAVFELMRTFKLPGFELFSDIVPHVRPDENKAVKAKPKKAAKKGKKKMADDLEDLDTKIEEAEEEETAPAIILDEEIGMGGPEGRVYWPPGMEEWLRPPKRVVKKKEEGATTPAKKKRKTAGAATAAATATATEEASVNGEINSDIKAPGKKAADKRAPSSNKKKTPKTVPTPSPSPSDDGDSSPLSDLGSEGEAAEPAVAKGRGAGRAVPTRKKSARAQRVSYREEEADELTV